MFSGLYFNMFQPSGSSPSQHNRLPFYLAYLNKPSLGVEINFSRWIERVCYRWDYTIKFMDYGKCCLWKCSMDLPIALAMQASYRICKQQTNLIMYRPYLQCRCLIYWKQWVFCIDKQGSSENDGRSDVYDRPEFKVLSNCCYPNCCQSNCSNFEKEL